jgi:hypothetical protein
MTDNTAAQTQETEATTEYTEEELNGETFRVKLATKWRPSYVRALRAGDFDTWSEGVIHPDDVDAWNSADPTFEEIGEFAARALSASGEAPGKSSVRSASSRSTRRK